MPKEKPTQDAARVFRDATFTAVPPARALDRILREHLSGASWNDVRRLVRTGKVRVDGVVETDSTRTLSAGATVAIRMSAPKPTTDGPVARDAIVYADAHLVVVRKPAGVATVPFDDERDTLDRLVQSLLRKTGAPGSSAPLGVVQRLDKETSGLIMFARTTTAKRHLQQQLRVHSVHRRYLAIVHGRVESRTFRSFLVRDRGDGLRGSTENSRLGREAVTRVVAEEPLAGATLVRCALETGRTHQIRIHLSEAGHPIVGDRVYTGDYKGEPIGASRLMLHAAELGFQHPVTGRELRFEEPLPSDMAAMAVRLAIPVR